LENDKYIREIDGNDEIVKFSHSKTVLRTVGCPFWGGKKVLDMKYHWFMMSFPCRSGKFPGTETLRREKLGITSKCLVNVDKFALFLWYQYAS